MAAEAHDHAGAWATVGAHDALGHACADDACVEAAPRRAARAADVGRALRLEYLTVAWNLIEGIIAVWAALGAGSVALLGFGIDSFVEMTSGLVLTWRLRAERVAADGQQLERLDRLAHRLVGASLFLLAAYVAWDASRALLLAERPEPTVVGLALTCVSIGVMLWLGRAKRRLAARLGSRALAADAFQTTACWWLSIVTLAGIGLNAACGWWWADPLAALGMTVFLLREGREAWQGDHCHC
jgi:divalent metal cation (Fe/Co/Zn/Cd) transporter